MRSNDEIINILTDLKDKKGLSLSELARRVGMAKSALSRYFNKTREFPLNRIEDFARALDSTSEYILGFEEDIIAPNYDNLNKHLESINTTENVQNIKTLPLYGDVAAGAIAEIEGVDVWDVETLDIPSVMLGRYANDDHLFSMYVNGDSMDRVIPSGAIIAVKTLDEYLYKDGDIVIFSNHGEYSLKRYRPNMIDGFVVFEPDSNNADFKNIAINNTALYEADEVSIYGKVIFFSTTL